VASGQSNPPFGREAPPTMVTSESTEYVSELAALILTVAIHGSSATVTSTVSVSDTPKKFVTVSVIVYVLASKNLGTTMRCEIDWSFRYSASCPLISSSPDEDVANQ
jgi:hypothetical protein